LDGHFYYSGEIPRVTSFEKGRNDHFCRTSPEAPWEPDPLLLDERLLVANVRGLGLIVFSSCSHAGIVNVCTHVRSLFPDVAIYAVLGGLHLGGVMERNIPDTVDGLKSFNIAHTITGHCTGWRAPRALANPVGDPVSQSAVGTPSTFSAKTSRCPTRALRQPVLRMRRRVPARARNQIVVAEARPAEWREVVIGRARLQDDIRH